MVVTDALADLVRRALADLSAAGLIDAGVSPEPHFERPRKREHGDWATNVALVAGQGRGAPRDIAQAIKERLPDSELVESVDVAGPGFLNFHLSPTWLHDVVRRAAEPTARFGMAAAPTGKSINLEYVSSNPTGPISVVSGRHAAVGDAMGNLLEAVGHTVTREFYVNDAGRQADLFARSLAFHYLQRYGVESEFPEDGYPGDYVAATAADVADEVGDSLVEMPEDERLERLRELGLSRMLSQMKASLERFGTRFDVWFSERTLHDEKEIEEVVNDLTRKGYAEEREGAVWFLASRLGDDKDRVMIRSSGAPTYLAADAAYVLDKFHRGFDHLIYLWGADHHGTVVRLKAVTEALGFDRDAVEIPLVQIVTLSSGGTAVKASKRAGVIVPLDELVDDVGVDAARYTFLNRSIDAPLDFDIELAKREAPENPVYYVQYAHARICSIMRKAAAEGTTPDPSTADLSVLGHPSEDALMRKLAAYEEVVPEAAQFRSPQRITRYVEELAADFSAFYRDCRVVSEDEGLTAARLSLCLATRGVLASGLALLGVNAPERM
ncbi:MAG: arginine--tRNA ligase [Actinomycetota bacterium]